MNVLVGEDANFRSGGNNVKMSLMTRKNGFDEIGRNWRSDAGYVGIAKPILKSVLGILRSMNDAGCGGIVETILRSVLSIVIVIVTTILGSILGAAVVILWGVSLFGAADFLRNNILRGIFLKLSGWWS